MSVSKETLNKRIADISPQDMEEVADFIGYLKMKREKNMLKELSQTYVRIKYICCQFLLLSRDLGW
jgi:ribosomal protein L22